MKPRLFVVFAAFLILSLLLNAGGAAAQPPEQPPAGPPAAPTTTIASSYDSTPPVVDGKIEFGEWPAAAQGLAFPHGYVVVVNDGIRLYVLLNVLQDTVKDEPSARAPDYYYLTFDVDGDGVIDANVDINYAPTTDVGNLRYQYYLAANQWTGLQPTTRSSQGRGFGCFFADGSFSFTSFFPFSFTCNQHRVWEFGIDLREISAQAGGSTRLGFRASSGTPSFTDNVPSNFTSSFADLIDITLAAPPSALPVANPSASISFETNPLELTQAIQTRTNTLPLVADKETVGRVYVQASGVAGTEPVIVYLYGSRSGVDLPGSPLAMLVNAPTSISRSNYNHTANFLLPNAWDDFGATTFQAAASRLVPGGAITTASSAHTFQSRRAPVVWIVPANTGTNASPTLPSNTEIASQEGYMEAMYPVPDIIFVRKNWQAIGTTTNLDDTIAKLQNYHGTAILAWALTYLFTGKAPFALPEGIYGFRPTGGGTSDPTWNGGDGYVAAGFRGTSREGTMAHEFVHNFDRGDAPGTWGRHIGGCGTDGPQASWPYANNQIQEVGFDTRLPWTTGTATRVTVIPNTDPDLMTYCQSGRLPTKWIAPYRWENLFSFFNPPTAAARAEGLIDTVYYISGQLNQVGTGNLDPVLEQPGLLSAGIEPGTYSIEIQDAAGNPLYTQTFLVSFVDPEGEPRPVVHFSFRLPVQPGAARIVLKNGSQVLDTILDTPNPPSITLTSPNGGEVWNGIETIEWTASDPDGDALTFTILYSTDNGSNWFPVADDVTGTSYSVDTALLLGSSSAIIRVIATDGLNNAHDDSNAVFTVADQPPVPTIHSPTLDERFETGNEITFTGDATDPEDITLPDTNFVWTYTPHTTGTPGTPVTFATGREASATLPDGVYQVTLTVYDSGGNAGATDVTFTVQVSRQYLPVTGR